MRVFFAGLPGNNVPSKPHKVYYGTISSPNINTQNTAKDVPNDFEDEITLKDIDMMENI